MSPSRGMLLGFGVPILFFIAIQLVPYGRDHTPPPTGPMVAWDSRRTLELARRACYDCHSNQTRWPWYASVAPFSWRIQTDVNLARAKLDFTAFDTAKMARAAARAAETVTREDMPPEDYIAMHPDARLAGADRQALVSGLQTTFASLARYRGAPAPPFH